MINGLVYDYESIKLQLPTGLVVLAESVSYNDKKDDEVVQGVSNLPAGLGRGAYSGECELEIGRSEYEKLNSHLAVESFFKTLKAEVEVFEYMELYCNKRRRHSALGYAILIAVTHCNVAYLLCIAPGEVQQYAAVFSAW
ncbi:MAG: hypothetical protein LBB43_01995 [Spirochaetaceae bacterium]|jgi:hypothetical protein|nr:hypothetical protein [Spirochaetaceae bacterium]